MASDTESYIVNVTEVLNDTHTHTVHLYNI